MSNLLISNGTIGALVIVIVVIAIAVGVAFMAASVLKWVLAIKYRSLNKIKNESGVTGEQAVNALIESQNLEGVTVRHLNWFQSLIWGNSYYVKKKEIRLRRNICEKTTITSVGVAVQKAGLAMLDKQGDKSVKFRGKIQPFIMLAPYLVLPMAIIGVLIDTVIAKSNIGVFTIIFAGLGLLYYLVMFIFAICTVKAEKKANNIALEMVADVEFLTIEERNALKELFNLYIISYIIDMITALLYFIKYLLKFIWTVLSVVSKRN